MKTQTAEEILMDYLKGDKGKGMTERYAIIAAMEFYHQQQLKILNIPVVNGQSEQLIFKKGDLVTYIGKNTMYLKKGKTYRVFDDCKGYFIKVRNDNGAIQTTNTSFFKK